MPSPGRTSCEIRELPFGDPLTQSGSSVPPRSRPSPALPETNRWPIETTLRHADLSRRGAHPRHALSQLRRPEPIGLSYVCPACFGPLEVDYDLDDRRATLTREAIARPRARHLAVRSSSCPSTRRHPRPAGRLDAADRPPTASAPTSVSTGCGSRTTPATRRCLSRIGRSRSPRPGPSGSGSRRWPAPRPATSPARRRRRRPRVGLPAYVFIPADLEPAKVDHALAYGATVVPIDGTYDDVNRLCLEVADETGWGFVNINLRPFYAEGSKTLAFEIAEGLGWRSPDVVVAPVASGAMFTRSPAGFEELPSSGYRAPADPVRRRPGRRLRAGRDGVGGRHRRHRAGPDARHDRALARHREPGRRPLRGRARAASPVAPSRRSRRRDSRGDPRGGAARGDLPRDGRGRDLAAAAAARRRGVIRRRRRSRRAADRQRAQDARRAALGRGRRRARPGQPGLAR